MVCARQFCSAPAAARVDFDGAARVVWIDELRDDRPAAAGCLCRRHADALVPPRHWDLRDLRSSSPAVIPDRVLAAATPTPPAWSPHLFDQVDTGSVLDARSPLLSRAFHGAR